MLQVQPDGKLLVTPEQGSSPFALGTKWLALLLLATALPPLGYVYAGVLGLGVATIFFVAVLAAAYIALKNKRNILKGGQFLVEAGRLTHKTAYASKSYVVDTALCHMQVVVLERGGFGLTVAYKQSALKNSSQNSPKAASQSHEFAVKSFMCAGLSEQEAVATKACLQGKKIGLNRKTIKMRCE